MSEPLGQLEQLTRAINRLADAYLAGQAAPTPADASSNTGAAPNVTVTTPADDTPPASGSKKGAGKGKAAASKKADDEPKPEHTKQEVLDAVVSVKDALGAPAARDLLSRHGFAKLAELNDPARFDAVYEDATALLAEQGGDASGDEEI